ncbi:hypothetical protein [Xanthomonas sp. F1]
MKPPHASATDVSDEEWAFAAPYLVMTHPQARQRALEVQRIPLEGTRWSALALDADEFPPWEMVYEQTQRRLQADRF